MKFNLIIVLLFMAGCVQVVDPMTGRPNGTMPVGVTPVAALPPNSPPINTAPVDNVSVVTPLLQGVYRGDLMCTLDTIGPTGVLLDQQTNTQRVTFEISQNGVPIIDGDEIRVDRSVTLDSARVTYTRVIATRNGIIVHANATDIGAEFFSIATMDQLTATSLIYRVTISGVNGNTTQINDCEGILEQ